MFCKVLSVRMKTKCEFQSCKMFVGGDGSYCSLEPGNYRGLFAEALYLITKLVDFLFNLLKLSLHIFPDGWDTLLEILDLTNKHFCSL